MTALAFDAAEYASRMTRAQARVRAAGLDALLLTSPENLCYLAGFSTPGYHVFQALVVPSEREPFLVVRNIEADNVLSRAWVRRYYLIHNLDEALGSFADAVREEHADAGTIGVEVDGARQSITRLDALGALLPRATCRPSLGLVDDLRAVKSEREIEYIRRAVDIAENAMAAGARSLREAKTDSDVAASVHAQLARDGSEFTGSPPYIVGGPASGRTHALHARRPLAPADHVWLEVAASVERYQGVSGRIAGAELTDDARLWFEVSASALRAMMAAARPGVTSGEVDRAGREAAARGGAGGYWRNRAAYSLGLSFPPGLGEGHIIDIKPGDPRVLRAGMVFHFIPIFKVPDVGAIGCTETVVVTDAGGARLGRLPLEPLTPDNVG